MKLNIDACYCLGKYFLLLIVFLSLVQPAFALATDNYVELHPATGSFPLFNQVPATIVADASDWPGVVRAANDLATDLNHVTGQQPEVVRELKSAGRNTVIIGTIGKSKFIDQLIRDKKIDVSDIAGKWESFFIQVVPKPFPGIDNALVICGSDKRGTIYGIYNLSEQIGVSPWHFWADVPSKHHDQLFVKAGKYVQGPPAVKYRGIFLNDEAPDLTEWVKEKFGTVPGKPGVANYGRSFYTNLFETILRLRGNYLWPAMWNNAFNEDDAENPRLADEYGIVMGTSHQEPMLRAQQEWDRGPGKKNGRWNWNNTNQQPVLQQFWRDGIRRNKDFESIITLGLRAENDSGAELGKGLTEQVIGVQRKILAEETNPDLTKVPQLWCLYKEVQSYYNEGLRVPDDVTMLWAEDNWGNVRRLPSVAERQRSGGAGVYYHFDYHGGPRNYQWINTSPIPKVWDQMSLAKQYGADRVWIVNVGHFKGSEFPLEFFMHLAWNTDKWTNDNLDDYTRLWAEREFGPEHAGEIADIISTYTKFNGRRKPELLDANTYSLVNYGEFEKVVADYESLTAQAEKINAQLPQESRDAFYELVLFPTKASAGLNAMYLAAAKNNLYAKQGRASANDFAAQTRALFAAQTNLMNDFNTQFAGGKWNHFMDQTHIGYTNWNEPKRNNLDAVQLMEIQVSEAAALGVAVDGSETFATNGEISLPQFDVFNQQRRQVDVFNRGKTPFEFSAVSDSPWIRLSEATGTIEKDKRVWVSVDWSKAPSGTSSGEIKISGAGGEVTVKISAFNPTEITRDSLQGFVESDGCVSIEAEHFTKNADAGSNRWIKIPNYGHTLSAMRADAPVDAQATPRKDSPCLEYKMYLFNAGKVEVESTVGATLNFIHGRALRYAVSFDDETPQVVTIVPADFNAQNGNQDWEESVKNNCRHITSTYTLTTAGYHTLKIWMVDPAVAVEKIVVNTGGVKPSYLGPPESFHRDVASSVSDRCAFSETNSWVGTWGCAPQLTEPNNLPPVPLANSTLRQFVRTSIGGKNLRVRFSNIFGTNSVTIHTAHLALATGKGSAGSGEINPATDKALTFHGAAEVIIPKGETVFSDPVELDLPALADVAVSIYFGEISTTTITGHPGSRTTSFIVASNFVSAASLPDAKKTPHWYLITGIEVQSDVAKTIVVLGDSITDGRGSTTDGNNRWPDALARRLSTNAPTGNIAVVNMGIGGNGIFGGLGPSAQKRVERDVLNQNGARYLIVFEGVNDIGSRVSSLTTATNLVNAYIQFASQAHARNLRAYGATITPFGGNGYYSDVHEQERQFVNAWFRTNTVFDGVIDFDAAVRNPVTLTNIQAAFFPGVNANDGLHLNPAGYKAMADAIDLNLFTQ